MKYFLRYKTVIFWILGLKTSFGLNGHKKGLSSRKSRTLAPIFTNQASSYPESEVDSSELTKLLYLHLGLLGLKASSGQLDQLSWANRARLTTP